jgi:Xaa-Pro aminopeptidase
VRCDECGFDGGSSSNDELVAAVQGFAVRYRAPLTRFLADEGDGVEVLRRRPSPAVWSALEYAAHARDSLDFYVARIERVLAEDRPTLTAVGWSAQAEIRKWNDEEPVAVAGSLAVVVERLAALLASLSASQWERVGLSSEGDGAERTVRVLAERAVHEGHHHLLDVGRSLRAARAR